MHQHLDRNLALVDRSLSIVDHWLLPPVSNRLLAERLTMIVYRPPSLSVPKHPRIHRHLNQVASLSTSSIECMTPGSRTSYWRPYGCDSLTQPRTFFPCLVCHSVDVFCCPWDHPSPYMWAINQSLSIPALSQAQSIPADSSNPGIISPAGVQVYQIKPSPSLFFNEEGRIYVACCSIQMENGMAGGRDQMDD